MNDSSETLWRSIDSSFDEIDPSSAEVSFKSLAGSSDASGTPPVLLTPQKNQVNIEEGLVNALRNLRLASVRKPCQFRPSMTSGAEKRGFEIANSGEENLSVNNCALQCVNHSDMKENYQLDLQSTIFPGNHRDEINLEEIEDLVDLLKKQPELLVSMVSEDLQVENASGEMQEPIQLVPKLENKSEQVKQTVETPDLQSSHIPEPLQTINNPEDTKELTQLVDELRQSFRLDQTQVQTSFPPDNFQTKNNTEEMDELFDLVDELVGSLQAEEPDVQSIVADTSQIARATLECVEAVRETKEFSELVDLPQQSGPQDPVDAPVSENNQSIINDKVTQKDPQSKKTALAKPAPLSITPSILYNMKKAVKPLLKPPNITRKTTVGVSPLLQTKSRCRVPKLSSSLSQLNQSTTNSQIKKKVGEVTAPRSSSLKKPLIKNVVATVVSTKEGIQLKEEKITNFGIPVNIVKKKKRTQTIPFSFATRGKESQQKEDKKVGQKLPMRDSNSVNQQKQMITNSATEKKTSVIKVQPVTKSLVFDESINKENRLINLNKSKTIVGGKKSSAGLNVKERPEFDEKIKGREKEIGAMRATIELKKQQKVKVADAEVKKKVEAKTSSVPVFKIPAPVRSKKPVRVSQK